MLEYIEKEFALELIRGRINKYRTKGVRDQLLYDTLRYLEKKIKSASAAKVAPMVHGIPVRKNRPRKYEGFEEVKTENGEILYKKHVYVDETNWAEYCPACGKRLCSRFKSYCPSCGAIMDLER